jgi:4-amino-4-deoxy-L-arabinose transferase-like glycosyltransferase
MPVGSSLGSRNWTLLGLVILVGLLVRIINIDQPFVDDWSYRQSDVAMVARNFYQRSYDILYPQIDYGGDQPGYVGMEFPIVPFFAAALYHVFGEHEFIGRVISLIFFLLSVPPLFFVVKMTTSRRAAFFAICMYTVMPLTIFCGRSFMSDMAAHSFGIWGVWLFAAWLRDRSCWRLFAAAITTAAAILTKAPYALLGLPIAYLAVRMFGVRAFIRRELWFFGFLALAPSLFWYAHAMEVSRSNYPNIPFLGHPDQFLVLLSVEKYQAILQKMLWELTPEVVLLALAGLTLLRAKSDEWLFLWWSAGMALLIVVAGDDNYRHEWYQLPITAPVAALAGMTADRLLSKSSGVLRGAGIAAAFTVGFTGLTTYHAYLMVRQWYAPIAEPLRAAGEAVDQLVPRGRLVLFASWGNPTTVYYSRRHGWLFREQFAAPRNAAEAISMLEMRRREGASYFVETSWEDELRWPPYSAFWRYLEKHFREVASSPEFTIFDLSVVRNETDDGTRP